MNHFAVLQKKTVQIVSILVLGLFMATPLLGQTTITHDISTGSLTIPGTSTSNYVIKGTTTVYTVTVQTNYNGTITLDNLNITSSSLSCITIEGFYNQSNLNPVTKVNIVLAGDNNLQNTSGKYCGIQVDQGAQIHISAINPNDNASGSLFANSTSYVKGTPITLDPPTPYTWANGSFGGAGIGAPQSVLQGTTTIECDYNKGSGPCSNLGSNNGTAGGNIIISSGTIFAHGGHGAGIGGGYQTYYDGIIIITGGNVQSYAQAHGAGIGSGCPCGQGVDNCYGPNSAIIVLPPAEILAAGAANKSPYHWRYETAYALAGSKNITYLNDPAKPLITVHTVDFEQNANIYLDLSETPGLTGVFNAVFAEYDLTKVRVGRTDASGLVQFHGLFEQNTTFFTDASSSQPGTLGRPYLPVTTKVLAAEEIVLPLLGTDISFTDIMSIPLEVGYTPAQAYTNAHRIKIEYNDPYPMTDITFALQDKIDFDTLIFLDANGVTPISTPTILNQGDVFYIVLPISQGRPLGYYSDVLLINGKYMDVQLPGYIRRIGRQRVAYEDSQTNTYIKVTASPVSFSESYASMNIVTLTLNIDHTGMTGISYAPLDVVAKYLITTEPDYAMALSANPLSGWSLLNVASANNTDATTDVSFSSLLPGTYYIHWYVESGAAYAHSLDVAAPPRTYGGFGPYELFPFEICAGTSVTFTATPYDGGSSPSYQWKKNGVNIDGATALTYTYIPEDGDTIICEMVSNAACADPDTVLSHSIVIKVNFPLLPVFNPVNDVCEGDSIIFSVASSYSAYEWHLGDSTGTIVSADSSIMQTSPGVYTYVLRVQDEQGCWSNYTLPVTATIKSLPSVSIAGSDSICIGTQTHLSPSGGGSWISNNPSIASVTNDGFVTGIAIGSATFTFTSLATGCSNTTDTVSVGAFPMVNAIIMEKDAVCVGETIRFSCTPAGGVWILSNNNARVIGDISANPVEIQGITTGQVYLSYTLGEGVCKSVSTFSIKIISTIIPAIMVGIEQ